MSTAQMTTESRAFVRGGLAVDQQVERWLSLCKFNGQ
jgi:hypothetical protein